MDRSRRAFVVPLVMLVIVLGRVVQSGMLQTVRAVDALTLFVAGALGGVVLTQLLVARRRGAAADG